MSKLPKDHKMSDHKDVVGQVMHRWKHKDPTPLHSGRGKGGKPGKVVKSQDQAIAISLSIAGKSKDHSESLISLGFSSDSARAVNELLKDSQESAFLTGKRKGALPRENKTTRATGLTSHDIDSRRGIQTGGQGKLKENETEIFSPLSSALQNPQTTSPSLNDRKGYSMFEEGSCPKPRSPAQRSATQAASQVARQQGETFDQKPQQQVRDLGRQGGEAPRKPQNKSCP
jgi:hypothetical protein